MTKIPFYIHKLLKNIMDGGMGDFVIGVPEEGCFGHLEDNRDPCSLVRVKSPSVMHLTAGRHEAASLRGESTFLPPSLRGEFFFFFFFFSGCLTMREQKYFCPYAARKRSRGVLLHQHYGNFLSLLLFLFLNSRLFFQFQMF